MANFSMTDDTLGAYCNFSDNQWHANNTVAGFMVTDDKSDVLSGISSFQAILSLTFQNARLFSHEHSFPTWHHTKITNNETDCIELLWGEPPWRLSYSNQHPQTLTYLLCTRIDRLPGPGRICSGEYSEPLIGSSSPWPLDRPPG